VERTYPFPVPAVISHFPVLFQLPTEIEPRRTAAARTLVGRKTRVGAFGDRSGATPVRVFYEARPSVILLLCFSGVTATPKHEQAPRLQPIAFFTFATTSSILNGL
jgi:hypothetical protein